MDATAEVTTKAWLLRGIGNLAGKMTLQGGRLRFVTLGGYGQLLSFQLRRLEKETGSAGLEKLVNDGLEATVLEVMLTDITQIVFPWYYFQGGVRLVINGVKYKFLFSAPSNSKISIERGAGEAVELFGALIEGRRAMKVWKVAFARTLTSSA